MPYDLSPLQEFFRFETPAEIAQVLDEAMYDIVVSAEQSDSAEGICQRYFTLRELRNILAGLEESTDDIITENEDPH